MKYKKFALLDAREISAIGFGGCGMDGTWNNAEDQKSIKAVQYAVENGINFFDNAPIYNKGHSEKLLGQAIKPYNREEIIIASKCGLVWDDKGNVNRVLSRDSILKEIDQSLLRLDTDYIDVYFCHWPDPTTPLEETLETLSELKQLGKIKTIALSNYSGAELERATQLATIGMYQGLYNMIEQNSIQSWGEPTSYSSKKEVIPVCKKHNIPYVPFSPIMQGFLTDRWGDDGVTFNDKDARWRNPNFHGQRYQDILAIVKDLRTIAKSINKPMVQLALNWLVDQPEMGPVICGASSSEQVKQNIAACDWDFSNQIRSEINAVFKKHEETLIKYGL